MAKTKKTRRSRFEGINLDSLNEEVAKVTNQKVEDKKDAGQEPVEETKTLMFFIFKI